MLAGGWEEDDDRGGRVWMLPSLQKEMEVNSLLLVMDGWKTPQFLSRLFGCQITLGLSEHLVPVGYNHHQIFEDVQRFAKIL